MKINVRLLLITFSIVVLISVSSTLVFYSLTNKILKDQHTSAILNSSNDFIFELQSSIAGIQDNFREIFRNPKDIPSVDLDTTQIDFVFTLENDSLIARNYFKVKKSIILNTGSRRIRNFVSDNSNIFLMYQQFKDGQIVYYGKVISSAFLEEMSQKIRSEIALVVNEAPVELSHPGENEKYLLSIIKAIKTLRFKNVYDLHYEELNTADFLASYYNPKSYLTTDIKYGFVIFSISSEAVDFSRTMSFILLIILLSGIALSFIFVLLFTAKLRKQLTYLSEAAEIAGKGNFSSRVKIVSKDEIGRLGLAFNRMLDELKLKSDTENEYSEFITLLNQNPTLHEVSDAVLKKILKASGLSLGALYFVEQNNMRLLSCYGISKEHAKPSSEVDYYDRAINEKEFIERIFEKNYPVIKTGITEIKVEYLIVAPIIYNKEVIAILELASELPPKRNIRGYIENIQEQLAIGLNNARSFEKLEIIIDELKKLNNDYQEQNKQILEKNEQLVVLHKKLEEKAAELEEQKEKAVELTKLKSQFLANISHELRTPLNSIIGLTELIVRDQQILPNNKSRLDIVLRNGQKLLNLINNILEFLKIESGKLEIKKERFLISKFLEELRDFVEPLFMEKNLKFSIEYNNSHDYLLDADKNKIEQVLINLIGNAVKFTEKGAVKIVVNILQNSDLHISVIDTGIGITEEFKNVIFEEFRQEDSSTTRRYSGTGLGLAIAKRYVQLMDGNISFESEIDKGTEFNVYLPNVILERLEIALEKSAEIGDNIKAVAVKTILVIDENSDTQKIITDYLTLNQFNVHCVADVEKAVEYAGLEKPHSIILSANLDKRNSWLVLNELKVNPKTKEIPVILISVIGDKKVGYGLSIFDYIFTKPVKKELCEKLEFIENFSHQKIRSIAVIDNQEENIQLLRDFFKNNEYELIHIGKPDEAKNKIQRFLPEAIIINLLADDSDTIDIVHQLKHTGGIKRIPILACTHRELTPIDAEELSDKLTAVTLKAKHHPMDVLKVLRDRLSIEYSEQMKESIIVDDFKDAGKNVIEKRDDTKLDAPKVRILIVDDDSDTLFTIGEIIRDLGYDTIYARNGVECLLTLNNVHPNLVLLDIMMPQMDGFETIKRIRSDSRFPNLPVIALTAYAMLDNKEVIEKNGFTDIITKPLNTNTLAFKIQKLLKQK